MATLNRTQAIPLNDYATGVYQLPETNIPNQALSFYFEIARCTTLTPTIWPNATTELDAKIELSLDNGNTWNFISGFRAKGGIHVLRSGAELSTTTLDTPIGSGNQRKLRGTFEVISGPLRTQGFFEARE